jgi:hypothetical protein
VDPPAWGCLLPLLATTCCAHVAFTRLRHERDTDEEALGTVNCLLALL